MWFYCKEPYDATHSARCSKRPKAHANAVILNELDVNLNEEILHQLEIEDTLDAEFGSLSLNAMACTDHGEAMKIRALVKNKVMLVLLDSGSSHCFISAQFLLKAGITPQPAAPKQVRVANGGILIYDKYVPNLELWVQGHSFTCDMRVIDLEAYDATLGFDWIQSHSPISHHWKNRTMELSHKGQQICITAILPAKLKLEELPVERLAKWLFGSDVWAMW